MNFYPAIWNVLHDGQIVAITGEIPGTIQIQVVIDYLRQRFTDPGKTIQVALNECERFTYQDYDSMDCIDDLASIAALKPEILSAEMKNDTSVVDCVGGTLQVCSASGSLMLDSGRSITLQELIEVSKSYWSEWSEHGKRKREKSS